MIEIGKLSNMFPRVDVMHAVIGDAFKTAQVLLLIRGVVLFGM